jgi:hypothetical protein
MTERELVSALAARIALRRTWPGDRAGRYEGRDP